MEGLDQATKEFSFENEKKIARKFTTRFQWEMMLIGLGQLIIWLTLWPLVIYNYISMPIGSFLAIICACFAYLPSHEAQHNNFSRGKPNKQWIDLIVGHLSLITLMFPYDLMKCTHMKHHAHTNIPEKDPDYPVASAKSFWEVIVRTQEGLSNYNQLIEQYKNDASFMKSFTKGVIIGMAYRIILLVMVFIFPLETFLMWWLPSKIGIIYLSTYFSWYPHYQTDIGRYKNTRFWSNWAPRYINHSMQLHFIHHLHPNIGHYDEPRAIEALKPYLIARNVPGADKIPEKISFNPLIKAN